MATTSLWRIKGDTVKTVHNVVDYALNPDKTELPAGKKQDFELRGGDDCGSEWLDGVLDYATRPGATEGFGVDDEGIEIAVRYVTGVSCNADCAKDEFLAVKHRYKKMDGTVLYHGYQSFAPGEDDPEAAHEIGVKLAEKLWGGRHQVVVTTHLDKEHHLHNHFVINTVSFVDGIKFYRSAKDYRDLKRMSDALCREYGLSVVEEPGKGKRVSAKKYAEWNAEKRGLPTYRSMMKKDIDRCIRCSYSERDFFDNLRKLGYAVKLGEDITLTAPGRERGLKLRRNFGDEYDIQSIRHRITETGMPSEGGGRGDGRAQATTYRVKGIFLMPRAKKKAKGWRALYLRYTLEIRRALGAARDVQRPRIDAGLWRAEVMHADRIREEFALLSQNRIDDSVQLERYKSGLKAEIAALADARREIKRKAEAGEIGGGAASKEIGSLSKQIAARRRKAALCDKIAERSRRAAELARLSAAAGRRGDERGIVEAAAKA